MTIIDKIKDLLRMLAENIHKRRRVVLALSCVVVFVTTYMLILPAFTLEKTKAAEQGGIDVPGVTTTAEDVSGEDADANDGQADAQDVQTETGKTEDGKVEDSGSKSKDSDEANADVSAEDTLTFKEEHYTIAVDDKNSVLPENTKIKVEEIDKNEDAKKYQKHFDDALAAIQEEKDGENVSDLEFARFYDISLMSDGKEINPSGGDSVNVSIQYDEQLRKALGVENKDNIRIIHFAENKNTGKVEAEVLNNKEAKVEINTDKKDQLKEASFEAESFSVYAVVYTVDFEYEDEATHEVYKYSMEGGSSITLKKLAVILGITAKDKADEFIANVEDVKFSDEELVKVEKTDNGWTLNSLKAFDTTETLTITMKDGSVYKVKVTDAQNRTVKISLLEDDGETPAEDTGLDNSNGYFIVARLTDTKGTEDNKDDEIIGYQFKFVSAADFPSCEWIYDDSQFKKVDESGIIAYDGTADHAINIRVYEGKSYDGGWRKNYSQIIELPDHIEGYIPLGSATDGNVTTVSFRKGFPAEYQVEITIDPSITAEELSGLTLYAEAAHQSTGPDKYYADLPASSQTIVIYDPNRDPASSWNENPGGRFTGNEKTRAIVKDSAGNEISSGSIINDLIINYPKRTFSEDEESHETKYTDHITITKVGEWENAKDPYDILGEGAEYGIIANKYIQRQHTESNFAAKIYENPNNINIEIDASGDGAMPFYVGEIHDHMWLSGANNVDLDIYVNEDYSSINRGNQGQQYPEYIWDTTPSNVDLTVYKLSQAQVNAKVDELINYFKRQSAEMAQKPSLVLNFDNSRTIDTTAYPDGKTIYIDASNLDFGSDGWKIRKLPNQTIVFNIPGEDTVTIREFSAIVVNSDGTEKTVSSNSGGNGGYSKDLEDEILDHIVFNAYETKLLEPRSGPSGIFLAPNGNAVEKTGSGTGWIATGGTFDQVGSEWHFFRTKRHYESKGDFTLSGQKKIIDSDGITELNYSDFKSLTFKFDLYECNENGEIPSGAKAIESAEANASGYFEFNKFKYTQEEVPEGSTQTFYYKIVEVDPQTTNDKGVSYNADPVYVKVIATDNGTSDISFQIFTKDGSDWKEVNGTGTDNKVYAIGDFKNTVESVDFSIVKVDKVNPSQKLEGAKFKITMLDEEQTTSKSIVYKKDSSDQLVFTRESDPTGKDGTISFQDLKAGYYEIKETQRPEGYIETEDPTFFIHVSGSDAVYIIRSTEDADANKKLNEWTVSNSGSGLVTYDKDNKTATVQNEFGTELPMTGGIGTTIFYIFGSILVIGGGIYFISRRRAMK